MKSVFILATGYMSNVYEQRRPQAAAAAGIDPKTS